MERAGKAWNWRRKVKCQVMNGIGFCFTDHCFLIFVILSYNRYLFITTCVICYTIVLFILCYSISICILRVLYNVLCVILM